MPRAHAALARARAAGKRIVVVSGRDLAFLVKAVGDACDAIVAENGCVLRGPDGLATPIGGLARELASALEKLDVPIERGEAMVSFDAVHEPLIREALDRAGLRARFVRNRERVMALPEGIDKAVGLLAALKMLGVAPHAAAAAGDGENDVPMLRGVGYAIAVQNAVDEVKEVADFVTARPGGEGVADWIEREWLGGRAA